MAKAVGTRELIDSSLPQDLAELQWRFSTPVTTLLLGVLGVPLCRATPRSSQYTKAVIAALIYAIFYGFSVMAKNWVQQGVVGPFPGLWRPEALLGLLVLLLLLPNLRSLGK